MASPPNYPIPDKRPRHGFVNIDTQQNNGFFIPKESYFVFSGTLSDITSHTTGQYVTANGTIARSNANSISLVAALERNYTNP